MRFNTYIIEKRSHDIPKVSVVDALSKYKNDPDIYISYTDVDKLGINPTFDFNTPLGIYFYPLKNVWKDVENNTIPFAGDRKWVWAVRSKDLLDLDKYNDARMTEDAIKLTAEFKPGNEEDFKEAYDHAKRDSKRNNGRFIFYFTHNLAEIILGPKQRSKVDNFGSVERPIWTVFGPDGKVKGQGYPSKESAQEFAEHLDKMFGSKPSINSNLVPAKWTIILRKILGYKGVRDSKGIIHPNEPIQAIIFTLRDLEVVEKITNIRPRENVIIKKTLREFLAPNLVKPQYLGNMISTQQVEYNLAAGGVLVKMPVSVWSKTSLDDFKYLLELRKQHDNIPIRAIMNVLVYNKYRPDLVKAAIEIGGITPIDRLDVGITTLSGRTVLNRIEEYFDKVIDNYASYGGYLFNITSIMETANFKMFKYLVDNLAIQYTDYMVLGQLILNMKTDKKESLGYLIGNKWIMNVERYSYSSKKSFINAMIKTFTDYILNDYKYIHSLVDLIDKKYVEQYYTGN